MSSVATTESPDAATVWIGLKFEIIIIIITGISSVETLFLEHRRDGCHLK